ncbi:hypothetical protein SDRG_05382 [Saprolegnia diclina VS20]|uniref:Uncharacterized protein n=1 Tax=Saprolegnia diclina (strain VS20) TaxID=1156394 RepID=T0QQX9_SAPDV|nr:hypothetical protein SDRG_05382 [Saprolegnia diclina VS20]EQC37156.1 hypothetical protein SDRG_05382 [Saprolegnia diclina VS20]|eukprot:XP_008609318.1 hypothetical protein SDRG_05382 [Saprolegnia diclina VS20]
MTIKDPTITKSEFVKVQAMTTADFKASNAADDRDSPQAGPHAKQEGKRPEDYTIRTGTKSAPPFLPEIDAGSVVEADAISSQKPRRRRRAKELGDKGSLF